MATMPASDGTTLARRAGIVQHAPTMAATAMSDARGCVHGASSTRIAPIQPRGAGMGAMMSTSGPENAWTAADHNGFGSWDTRSERKLGYSASSEWGYFSSPLERPSFFGSLPARLRASRKIHSTWPLALRISSSAQRWTASHMTGSMRRGYCLRAMFLSSLSQRLSQAPHLGVQSSGAARLACALLFRPNLQHLEKAYTRVDVSTENLRSVPGAPRIHRREPP